MSSKSPRLSFREIAKMFVQNQTNLIALSLSRSVDRTTAYRIRRFLRIEKACFNQMLKKGAGNFNSRMTREAIIAVMALRNDEDRTEAGDIMRAMVAARWSLAAHVKNTMKFDTLDYGFQQK